MEDETENKVEHKTEHPGSPCTSPAGARIRRMFPDSGTSGGLMRQFISRRRGSHVKTLSANGVGE
eukprot:11159416-Prorocentrum_lima.AAC.1